MKLSLATYAFITGAVLSELIAFILSEKLQFISIFFVVALDLIFGASRALYEKRFETHKAFKSVFMLGAFWSLLAVVLIIELAYPYVSFLSEAILLPIILFQIISILKNMNVLGLLSSEMLNQILSRIDKHKEEKK